MQDTKPQRFTAFAFTPENSEVQKRETCWKTLVQICWWEKIQVYYKTEENLILNWSPGQRVHVWVCVCHTVVLGQCPTASLQAMASNFGSIRKMGFCGSNPSWMGPWADRVPKWHGVRYSFQKNGVWSHTCWLGLARALSHEQFQGTNEAGNGSVQAAT